MMANEILERLGCNRSDRRIEASQTHRNTPIQVKLFQVKEDGSEVLIAEASGDDLDTAYANLEGKVR